MIAEQLQAARAAHWRQNQSPLLTLDDAQSWISQHPLCLYLPRHAQLPTPAPSFVEACLGKPQTAPTLAAIEQAQALLVRLVASGTVVPLNLFGVVGEQPDFLAHRDALPAVLSLRADPDWKKAPQKSSGHKVSPLVLELWKVLDKENSLTAEQAREILGRELTEAAVLRALSELWQGLRVSPVYGEPGQPAHWELLRVQHRDALAKAGSTGQVTAISLLVSMYLQSVYSATSDEIELFLSPVTSRSRVREAVRGLAATRQIQSLSMDAQTYFFLENGLPEFAAIAAKAAETEQSGEAGGDAGLTPAPARPAFRKRQAIAQVPAVPALPAAAAPGAEPIFRRPKPEFKPAAGPESMPPARPAATRPAATRPATSRPASARPAAAAGWKSQGRPAAPGRTGFPARPAGPPGDRPAASRPRWGSSDAERPRPTPGARPSFGAERPRPQSDGASRPYASRPPRSAGPPREGARPYVRPNAGPNTQARGARPEARPARPGAARPYSRPDGARPAFGSGRRPAFKKAGFASGAKPETPRSDWAGARKPSAPKPWALPGRKADTSPRPPRAGARSTGGEAFRPRAPRGDRGPGDPSRSRAGSAAAGRTTGRPPARSPRPPSASRPPSAYGAARPPAGAGRPAPGARPPYRSGTSARPARSAEGRSGPPRTGRPSGSAPARFSAGSRPAPRTGAPDREARPGTRSPRSDRPTPSRTADRPSSFRPAGRPSRPAGTSSRPPRTGDRPTFDRPRGDRPRPGSFGPSGVKSGTGSRDAKGRPPFKPGSRPAKPYAARPGGSSAKPGVRPGKPSSSFRGPRPDRKKPAE